MNDKSTRTARSRSYSDWQVRRIRYALKAHHSAQSAGEKRIESWRYIAETVDGYHGVEATPREIARFAERIRQFVEGVPKPKAVEKAFGKGYIREKEKEKERGKRKRKKRKRGRAGQKKRHSASFGGGKTGSYQKRIVGLSCTTTFARNR